MPWTMRYGRSDVMYSNGLKVDELHGHKFCKVLSSHNTAVSRVLVGDHPHQDWEWINKGGSWVKQKLVNTTRT
jgi:hypothetical protein